MSMFIILVLLAAAGSWLVLQPKGRSSKSSPTAHPLRITNPKLQGAELGRLWQLHTNGCRCEVARQLGGRRLDIDDTVPLRLFGGTAECSCHYRPLAEARRTPRRSYEDRREALRFDLSRGDRRMRQERRQHRDGWERQMVVR